MSGLVLSLFPGIGLLDMAFEEAGFCVVRGPDLLWGGDIHKFHPPAGRFDGVIGGPPCQFASRLVHIVRANGYEVAENLIPEFERVIGEARPAWFLMENVEHAPIPVCKYGHRYYPNKSVLLRDVWVGGETDRLRRFTFGCRSGADHFHVDTLALHRPDPEHSALASGGGRPVPVAIGGNGKIKRSAKSALRNYGYKTTGALTNHLRLQGLPTDFLSEAPFTVAGKIHAVGNGVPLAMGRAVAAAVKRAIAAEKVAA